MKKNYSFQFMLTDRTIQQRIIDFISPINNRMEILNLQLAYGIVETQNNLFLTRIKTVDRTDRNTGQPYYTTRFVVLTKDESFAASYTSDNLSDAGILTYDLPKGYEAILSQAFDYWRNWGEHKTFETELRSQNQNLSLLKMNADLCKPLYKVLEERGKQKVERLEDQDKKHLEIHSEEDAKQLFFEGNTNYYEKYLKENYDEKTILQFEQYATREKKKEWVLDRCRNILSQIINGDREDLYDKLSIVSGRLNFWISSEDDDLATMYTKTCRLLFDSGIEVPLRSINSYLRLFEDRFNPLHIVELLDMTEHYVKVQRAELCAKNDINGAEHRFQEINAQLRGKIEELSPIENIHNFRFVLTGQSKISQIVEYYEEKYHDVEAVKESVAYLNCAYGVQNEEVFLTSNSDEADNYYSDCRYGFNYVAILLRENQVIEFDCRRNSETGKFEIAHKSVSDFPQSLMDAVAFFRNKAEREAFFEEYKNSHNGTSIRYLKVEARAALFATFALSYEAELQRIGDNPLADTLKKLIQLCEERAHEYGFNSTIIYEGVSNEEIEQWEQENHMKLPESYCHFLHFANGVQVFDASERIYGIDSIGAWGEHLEADYISIGEMIGDGTTLCLSKTTGKAYVEDHGKYKEYGDFKDLLEYFIEFLAW